MRIIGKLKEYILGARIQTKLTIAIVIAIFAPFLVAGLSLGNKFYDMVIADTIRNEQRESSEIVPEISDEVISITRCVDSIMNHEYYYRWFNSPQVDDPQRLANAGDAWEFRSFIQNMIDNTSVNAVKIYLSIPEEDEIYKQQALKDIFTPESEITSTYWHGIFDGGAYARLFCPPFYLGKREIDDLGDSAIICRESTYIGGVVYPVYLAVYYDSDVYKEVLNRQNRVEGSVSYIINARDSLVVTTDSALSGTYRVRYADVLASLMSSNSFVEREIADVSVYTAFYAIENTDWFLVNVIPREPLITIANKYVNQIIAIGFICVILAVIIATRITRSITGRISNVSAQMSKVYYGPPVAMEEAKVKDEVGDLIDSYNFMTREMNALMSERERTARELRYAEFNALQAQINPHFLYNTMDMINWMALQGRNKEVSETVQRLSRFYKLTLSRKKASSTIEDELEHAKVYVQLQNMRFQDAIDFVVDVPDNLLPCSIPKLTFQPIIENAILHGILETEKKCGIIVVTAWQEDSDICILISDDGAGMSEEIRRNILSPDRMISPEAKGTNVAIVNTHRRIQLLHGEKYGLSYSSAVGEGCEVTIRLPLLMNS